MPVLCFIRESLYATHMSFICCIETKKEQQIEHDVGPVNFEYYIAESLNYSNAIVLVLIEDCKLLYSQMSPPINVY